MIKVQHKSSNKKNLQKQNNATGHNWHLFPNIKYKFIHKSAIMWS